MAMYTCVYKPEPVFCCHCGTELTYKNTEILQIGIDEIIEFCKKCCNELRGK